ncbi:DUF2177 family protein [Nitratireductor mangrovi]|uniref:DUF2177 family protein n=1 Tax=Nitratireductor mangrovi TaxID=2599600 RepID=A0A5B8L4P4_9HYPH|nr:DUF2177 family protein [Nitratireductor mangrovi]QDZ02528.1 DUF2177 family protein [Nitratireductor mangrovi]
MRFLAAYGIAATIFLAIDLVWIGLVARGFYASRLGELLLPQPRAGVAVIFYAVYVAGLVYFAVSAGLANGSWQTAALNGALFGFFCYLTYDATNYATLAGYDPVVAIVDTLWGTVLSGFVAGATVLVLQAFAPS